MRLHPFLFLTTLLLGSCGKKDTAPGSTPPDLAATQSTFRDNDHEARASRRERFVKREVMEKLDFLIRGLNENTLPREERNESGMTFHFLIARIDPEDFDALWNKIGALEDKDAREGAQVAAIYYLSAERNLVLAGRKVGELLFPVVPEEERPLLLGKLLVASSPTLPETIDFMREFGSIRKREIVAEYFPLFEGDQYDLTSLKKANYRLNLEESGLLLIGLLRLGSFGGDASSLLGTVTSFEGQGVFAKGTRDEFLLETLRFYPNTFFEIVPPEEVRNQLSKETYDPVIQSVVKRSLSLSPDPFAPNDIPHFFFTPDGTHNLPPEKTALALGAWHSITPAPAEEWFANNAAALASSQRDKIRSAFALNLWNKDKAASEAWFDEISDPAVKQATIARQILMEGEFPKKAILPGESMPPR